mmetsp:Transcript_13035/g.14344  ORF Transcript_13035/g.14344 Transcript_13035/m.14344 type:complete len:1321 (+) Transcript_13035:55-4017(+)
MADRFYNEEDFTHHSDPQFDHRQDREDLSEKKRQWRNELDSLTQAVREEIDHEDGNKFGQYQQGQQQPLFQRVDHRGMPTRPVANRPQSAKTVNPQVNSWMHNASDYNGNEQGFLPNQNQRSMRPSSAKRAPSPGGTKHSFFKGSHHQPSASYKFTPKQFRPQTLHVDKEQLMDDTRSLKQKVNVLKDENVKLRTKLNASEREVGRRDKTIEELLDQTRTGNGMLQPRVRKQQEESHLVATLKKKIKELQRVNAQKDEEMTSVKKNIKSTRITELEIESKTYIDESIRLRHILEELSKQKGTSMGAQYDPNGAAASTQRLADQSMKIEQLEKENAEIVELYHKLEDERDHWAAKVEELDSKLSKQGGPKDKLSKMKSDNSQLRSLVDHKENELQELRENLDQTKDQMSRMINDMQMKNSQISNSNSQVTEQGSQIEKLSNDLQEYKQQLQRVKSELNDARQDYQQEKQRSEELNVNYELVKRQLMEVKKEQRERTETIESRGVGVIDSGARNEQGSRPVTSGSKRGSEIGNLSSKSSKTDLKMGNIVPKLAKIEVQSLLTGLRVALEANGIHYVDVEHIISDNSRGSSINIRSLVPVLQKYPFEIKGSDAARLARYLIEFPQHGDTIDFSEDRSMTVREIVNTLQSEMGDLIEFGYDDSNRLKRKAEKMVAANRITLSNAFRLADMRELGYLDYEGFTEALQNSEIKYENKLLEYIFVHLFKEGQQRNQIQYREFMSLFGTKFEDSDEDEEAAVHEQVHTRDTPVGVDSGDENNRGSIIEHEDRDAGLYLGTNDQKEEEEEYDEDEAENEYAEEEVDSHHSDRQDAKEEQKSEDRPEEEQSADGVSQGEGGDEEVEEITEEEAAEILDNCFKKIAEAIVDHQTNVEDLFGEDVFVEEDIPFLDFRDFFKKLETIGLTELTIIEFKLLVEVLDAYSVKRVSYAHLYEGMKEFGIGTESEPNSHRATGSKVVTGEMDLGHHRIEEENSRLEEFSQRDGDQPKIYTQEGSDADEYDDDEGVSEHFGEENQKLDTSIEKRTQEMNNMKISQEKEGEKSPEGEAVDGHVRLEHDSGHKATEPRIDTAENKYSPKTKEESPKFSGSLIPQDNDAESEEEVTENYDDDERYSDVDDEVAKVTSSHKSRPVTEEEEENDEKHRELDAKPHLSKYTHNDVAPLTVKETTKDKDEEDSTPIVKNPVTTKTDQNEDSYEMVEEVASMDSNVEEEEDKEKQTENHAEFPSKNEKKIEENKKPKVEIVRQEDSSDDDDYGYEDDGFGKNHTKNKTTNDKNISGQDIGEEIGEEFEIGAIDDGDVDEISEDYDL